MGISMDGGNFYKELISINILRASEQQVSKWAGGTTTQLAIYPKNSSYMERSFEWRVSTARVDSEESAFTPLPGVHRILMILEGQMELTHEGIRSVSLKSFEQDEFDGGWTTKSLGRCVDFNLMTMGRSVKGKLEAAVPQSLNLFEQEVSSEAWEAFYCFSAAINVTINIHDEIFTSKIKKGDFLLINAKKGVHSIKFSRDHIETSPAAAVRATIYKIR